MRTGIFYTTKHGVTEKVAKELEKRIAKGEVELINDFGYDIDLESYDNIIIGSGIYAGKIPDKIKKFVEKNHETILSKNHGIYICSRNVGETAKTYIANNFDLELLQSSFCVAHMGHGIEMKKLGFLSKLLFKYKFKITEDYYKINKKEIGIFVNELLKEQAKNQKINR